MFLAVCGERLISLTLPPKCFFFKKFCFIFYIFSFLSSLRIITKVRRIFNRKTEVLISERNEREEPATGKG